MSKIGWMRVVRRPKVKRGPGGLPLDVDRCQYTQVIDLTELFPRRCRKARRRGSAFCERHAGTIRLETLTGDPTLDSDAELSPLVGEPVAVTPLDALAECLIPFLDWAAEQ